MIRTLPALLMTLCLFCPALHAEEADVAVAATPADKIETWTAHRPDSWLRLAHGRLSNVLCELGPAGDLVDRMLERYLRALEAGPDGDIILPAPAAPEWCDGVTPGPPPDDPSRFMVRLSFRF